MEELQLDFGDDELESVEKYKYGFPTVHVMPDCIYFNSCASPYVPKAIRWFSTAEYIIGLPANAEKGSFKVSNCPSTKDTKRTSFPVSLREKRVRCGVYKLYKYKDGVAFKRYEPIEIDEVKS